MRLSLRLELLGRTISLDLSDTETAAETPMISDMPQPMAVYAEVDETPVGFHRRYDGANDLRGELRA